MQSYETFTPSVSCEPAPSSNGRDSDASEQALETNPRSADGSHTLTPDLLARANAYAVLGAVIATVPTNQMLATILPAADSLTDTTGDLAESWRRLAAINTTTNPSFTDAALDDEYHALFIGIVRGEVIPYGSWYMSGFLMDKPLAALRHDLRVLGFERAKGVREPEDHAGALCETMAMIIQAEDVSERAEKTFFEKHMRPWMQLFFKDLEAAKSAEFYALVAQFGQQFIAFEKEYFDI